MTAAIGQLRLFALTESEAFPDWLSAAQSLCSKAQSGSVAVVLRDREQSVKKRLAWGQELRRITRDTGQLLFVSDRVDLALALSADGVHLPAQGFSPSACRKIWAGLISRSGHHLNLLAQEDWQTLQALLVSPVCAPRKGRPSLGLSGLSMTIAEVHNIAPGLPIFALGGVTAESCPACLTAGAQGVAAIGSVWDPRARRALLSALGILAENE